MKVLVVGGGGREHAIIRKLKESKKVTSIACCPGNGGIARDAKCYNVSATDIEGVVKLAKKIQPDFVVVAPDDPLVMGMVDALNEAGFDTFGPDKRAAIIEGSKAFSKELMKKYNIPTADYEIFDNPESALEYIKEKNEFPTVIKADGLALGKGVIIAEDMQQAEDGIKEIMEDKVFGDSGSKVVIEEYLTGPEVSVLAFTDGYTVRPMLSSMDHKRAHDGDKGLNTGGMGTVAPNPFYTPQIAKICMSKIFIPTIRAMRSEGRTFRGCLYFGLMLTAKGPKVIEYNCRFGDPEAQVVLPLLKTDIMTIFDAISKSNLSNLKIEWSKQKAVCVIAASGGYPKSYPKGKTISGLNENGQLGLKGVSVYHAGTALNKDEFETSGGRVLGVTAVAPTLQGAIDRAYTSVKKIHFDGMFYRHDIAEKALFAEREMIKMPVVVYNAAIERIAEKEREKEIREADEESADVDIELKLDTEETETEPEQTEETIDETPDVEPELTDEATDETTDEAVEEAVEEEEEEETADDEADVSADEPEETEEPEAAADENNESDGEDSSADVPEQEQE